MSRQIALCCFTAWILVGFCPAVVRAGGGFLRVIARAGQEAPDGRGEFLSFGQLNGSDPAISGENIAFLAAAEHAGGIYAWIDGELRVIADTMTTFPGTNVPFGFDGLSAHSPSISGRNIAFGAFRGQPGNQVICAWLDGEFRIIAVAGETPAPGSKSTFRSFFLGEAEPSISGENVAFSALNEDSSNGVYAFINGEMRVIANTDMLVPGVSPPTKFLQFGQGSGTSPSISGENVAFIGVWRNPADGALYSGVFARINGLLRAIAKTGDPRPPGSDSRCGTTFGKFGFSEGAQPSISGENIAFSDCGVIAYINGQLHPMTSTDPPTPAPGATGNFGLGVPVSPVIDGENIAFCAGADGLQGGHGVFALIDGSFYLIAREGTQVPGMPGSTFTWFFPFGPDSSEGNQLEGVSPAISGRNVVFTAAPNGVYAFIPGDPPPPAIPTLSAWSLVVLGLLTLTVGTLILRMPRPTFSSATASLFARTTFVRWLPGSPQALTARIRSC